MATVETPGRARSLALDGNLLAVADGSGGLALVDVSLPVVAIDTAAPYAIEVVPAAGASQVELEAYAQDGAAGNRSMSETVWGDVLPDDQPVACIVAPPPSASVIVFFNGGGGGEG